MSNRIECILAEGMRDHDLEPPATEGDVSTLELKCNFVLPEIYLEFLLTHNGGSGELPVQPCWYEVWPANEVLENNKNYEVAEHLPEFLAIGSNQGGELIYIDYRASSKGNIVAIPLIPTDPDYANKMSSNFEEFISIMGRPCECE